jgi:methyltransferase family protein
MSIKPRSLVIGAATYVPGLRNLTGRTTGGTVSARYCYSVWLRHLYMLHQHGLPTTFGTVVELGPGDSLGVGLAALLTGAERYIALDAVRYADSTRNIQVLEDLAILLRERTAIPDQAEFPLLQPPLPSYAFPAKFLTPERLEPALRPARVDMIRAALANPGSSPHGRGPVCYSAPWTVGMIEDAMVDLVISQGVLQFVHDLRDIYKGMAKWLRPRGIMSHEIAFQSIGITTEWNGHWSCPEAVWRLAAGRRRHVTNREPHSTHIALLQEAGCRVVTDECIVRHSGIGREELAHRFRHLTDQDLVTASALIQAVKFS